jgi:hypothetical protein
MILAVSRVNRSQNRTSLFQAFADDFKGLCGQRRFVEQRFTTPQLLGPIGSMRRRDGEVETPGAGRGLSIHRVRPGMSAAAGTVGLSVDAVSVVTDAEGESALDERAGIAARPCRLAIVSERLRRRPPVGCQCADEHEAKFRVCQPQHWRVDLPP